MIRTFAQQDVIDLAKYGQVPVINGLTDDFHPCQALADCLTIREHCGDLKGKHLVYVGRRQQRRPLADDRRRQDRHERDRLHAARLRSQGLGHGVGARRRQGDGSHHRGGPTTCGRGCEGADVIYTDTWTSMGQEKPSTTSGVKAMRGYQVNMRAARSWPARRCKVMHCLPAHWGEEITEEVLYSPHSVVFDQAENRMHAQKAIMAAIMT